ncbi:MAG: energy transducer TonB [Candidatus Cyclobacteriaceae bacterium M2_1C_046]
MKKLPNRLFIYSICASLLLFSQCEPRGSNREKIEDEGDPNYEMLEGEDVPPAGEDEHALDSAEISHMKQLQDENLRYKRVLDSIAEVNPNITYTYTPVNGGRIKTVLGDYKVAVDNLNLMTEEEEETIALILEKRFQNRQEMLKYYNKLQNVDLPAKPKEGFSAFYEELRENISYPEEAKKLDTEGLIFVQLAVEKDGSISNIKVSENINTANNDLEEEIEDAAIEAVKETTGKWKAAQKNGEPVRSKLEIPIWFDPDTTRS